MQKTLAIIAASTLLLTGCSSEDTTSTSQATVSEPTAAESSAPASEAYDPNKPFQLNVGEDVRTECTANDRETCNASLLLESIEAIPTCDGKDFSQFGMPAPENSQLIKATVVVEARSPFPLGNNPSSFTSMFKFSAMDDTGIVTPIDRNNERCRRIDGSDFGDTIGVGEKTRMYIYVDVPVNATELRMTYIPNGGGISIDLEKNLKN